MTNKAIIYNINLELSSSELNIS